MFCTHNSSSIPTQQVRLAWTPYSQNTRSLILIIFFCTIILFFSKIAANQENTLILFEFTSPLIHIFFSLTKIMSYIRNLNTGINFFTQKIPHFFLISLPSAAGRVALLRVFVTSLSLWFKRRIIESCFIIPVSFPLPGSTTVVLSVWLFVSAPLEICVQTTKGWWLPNAEIASMCSVGW